MNMKLHHTKIIGLLIVAALVLVACGTLQIEPVEPTVSATDTPEKTELDEPASAPVLEETAVSPTPPPVTAEHTPTPIPPTPPIEATPATNGGTMPEETNLTYHNDTFGFTLPLPETWQGYNVTQNDHAGVTNFCFTFVGSAPICVLQIDVFSQENWDELDKVPDDYYLAENSLFVFASGPYQEECVQLDDFQCARYQEIPAILAGFIVEQ